MTQSTIAQPVRETGAGSVPLSEPVTIIVPAYNEAEGIGAVLDTIINCMHDAGVQYELLVVDDGSTDGTGAIVEEKGVRILRHKFNKGYGASIKTGIRQARYPLMAIIDADGTYPVDALLRLLACMSEYDMAIGARTGDHVKIQPLRRPAKWFLKSSRTI